MVEVLPDPALNPGEGDFEYGAAVWLSPEQTTTGSNIVQKGRFGTAGGLWKLQVDTDAGEPSCVVRSGTDELIVRSSVSIADSAWHFVVCRRDKEGLSIQRRRHGGPGGRSDRLGEQRVAGPRRQPGCG